MLHRLFFQVSGKTIKLLRDGQKVDVKINRSADGNLSVQQTQSKTSETNTAPVEMELKNGIWQKTENSRSAETKANNQAEANSKIQERQTTSNHLKEQLNQQLNQAKAKTTAEKTNITNASQTVEATSTKETIQSNTAKPSDADVKFWNQKELGLGQVVERALTRTDLDQTTAKSVSETLIQIKDAIKNNKLQVSGSLRDLVSSLGKSDPKKVSESLAELERAAEVVRRADLAPNTKVIIGARDGQQLTKTTGLPDIDVAKVEADVYYKTADGVVHLNEVKDTFNALTTKLDKSIKAKELGNDDKQFERYGKWVEKGEKAGEVRQVTVVVRKTGPGFDALLEPDRLTEFRRITGGNGNQPVLQVGGRVLSLDDLTQMRNDAFKKLGDLKKQNPSKSFNDLTKEYFGSLEKSFETLGKEYGLKVEETK